MAADPDAPPVELVREALRELRERHARVMGGISHAELLMLAWEGKIADDEVPLLPPGDPGWLRQARETLGQADAACDDLKTAIVTAQLRIGELIPGWPDLALSINLDIVVSRHRATPRGTP